MAKLDSYLKDFDAQLKATKRRTNLTPLIDNDLKNTDVEGAPKIYSSSQARQLFNIDLPDDNYMLKVTPGDNGYSFSYITPSKHEVTDKGTLNDLNGNPVSGDAIVDPDQYTAPVWGGELQYLNDKITIKEIFGDVIPQSDLNELQTYVASNPDEFISKIQTAGRSDSSVRLLTKLGVTSNVIDKIFTQPQKPQQVVPVPNSLASQGVDSQSVLNYIKNKGTNPVNPEEIGKSENNTPQNNPDRYINLDQSTGTYKVRLSDGNEEVFASQQAARDFVTTGYLDYGKSTKSPEEVAQEEAQDEANKSWWKRQLVPKDSQSNLFNIFGDATPEDIINSPELNLALVGLIPGPTLNKVTILADAMVNAGYGAAMGADTFANRKELTTAQLIMGYGLSAVGLIGGGAQAKGALNGAAQKFALKTAKNAGYKTVEEYLQSETGAVGKNVGKGEVPKIINESTENPANLIYREKQQNRLDFVRKTYPDFEDVPPITAVKTNRGLEIIDGHNRATVAKEMDKKVQTISIDESLYNKLKDAGYDDMEITYAMLSKSGYEDAASTLDSQFPGANLTRKGLEAEKIINKEESNTAAGQGGVKQPITGEVVPENQATVAKNATVQPKATPETSLKSAEIPSVKETPSESQTVKPQEQIKATATQPVTPKTGAVGITLPQQTRTPIRQGKTTGATTQQPPTQAGAGGTTPPPNFPSGKVPGGFGNQKPSPVVDNLQLAIDALTPDEVGLKQTLINFKNKVVRAMYQDIRPFKDLENKTDVPVWKYAKLVKGSVAAGEDIIRVEILPVLRPVAKDMENLKLFMSLQRDIDIAARNPKAFLPGGVQGQAGALHALDQLKLKIGQSRYSSIETAAKKLYALNDKWKLQVLEKAGIIDANTHRAILADNPHYIPFFRSDFTDDVVSNLRSRSEASVSQTGIKTMTEEGSTRKLDDPLSNWMGQFIQVQETVARNTAAKSVISGLQELEKRTGEVLVTPVIGKAESSKVIDTISYYVNGKKETVQVPTIYAVTAKSLDAEASNVLIKAASIMNAPLRYGAVTYNPGFIPVNMLRDATTAFFREKLIPFSPSYFKGWWAVITKNKTFSEVARGGGLMSGIVESMRSTDAVKIATKGGIPLNNAGDIALLVPRLIEKLNLAAEQSTRVATYIKLKDSGIPQLDAIVRTRDVSVDFAQMGTWMKVINSIIPFSNASLQGTINVARTFKNNPKWALLASSPFVTATILSRVNNMRYETSKDIPYYEYTNYWIIQFGEYDKEDGNKAPLYFKIPKGQLGAVLTFPGEALFSYTQNQNNRSAVDIILEAGKNAIESASPVPTDISGLLPSAISTGVELQTKTNMFSGMPIVPRSEENLLPEQQYGTTTSKIAIAAGKQFNISPRLVDFAIKDYTAGAGQGTLWLTDLALGAVGYNPEVYGNEIKKPTTGIEGITNIPVLNRFVGVKSNQEEREGWDTFETVSEDTNRQFAQMEQFNNLGIRLGEVGTSLNGIELSPQERAQYQQIMADIVIPAMQDAIEKTSDMNPEDQRKALEKYMNQYKDEARSQFALQGGKKFVTSWEQYSQQLGLPKYSDSSNTIESPIYSTKNLYSDIGAFINKADAKDAGNLPPQVQAVIKAKDIAESQKYTLKESPYKINADPFKDGKATDTYLQYIKQWDIRQTLLDQPDKLADFDDKFPNAKLGNISQTIRSLLYQYHSMDEESQVQFLKDHPELNQNPYEKYLKDHPDENAQLALFGQAKIYTSEALKKMQEMIKTLDIPDNAIPDTLGEEIPELAKDETTRIKLTFEKQYSEYSAIKYGDTYKDNQKEAKEKEAYLKANPDFRDEMRRREVLIADPEASETIQNFYIKYYQIEGTNQATKRTNFRRAHPEFEQWLEEFKGYKPLTQGSTFKF